MNEMNPTFPEGQEQAADPGMLRVMVGAMHAAVSVGYRTGRATERIRHIAEGYRDETAALVSGQPELDVFNIAEQAEAQTSFARQVAKDALVAGAKTAGRHVLMSIEQKIATTPESSRFIRALGWMAGAAATRI